MFPFKSLSAIWRIAPLVGLFSATAIGAGCRPSSPPANARPSYAVTIPPLAAIIRELAEGRADVTVILPPGASPHTYELRPADARGAASARAVFYVDETLDAWAARLDAPAHVRVLDLLPEDAVHRYAEGVKDPHIWLDPGTMLQLLPRLVDTLGGLDPEGAGTYKRNGEALAKEIEQLDRELGQTLAPLRGKTVVQFHPSLFYFFERYGIRTAGVIETIAGQEPTPKDLARLAEIIKSQHVDLIVTEPQLPEAPVKTLAEATGVPIARTDPLGGGPGRIQYVDLVRYNARALLEAGR